MDAFDMASVLKLEKRIGKKFTKVRGWLSLSHMP